MDWPALFGDYQATADFPGCSFYKELMGAYPDAKVLLTMRDPERWYESTHETVYQLSLLMPRWLRWPQRFSEIHRLLSEVYWGGRFEGKFEDRDRAIALFNAWNAEVHVTGLPLTGLSLNLMLVANFSGIILMYKNLFEILLSYQLPL